MQILTSAETTYVVAENLLEIDQARELTQLIESMHKWNANQSDFYSRHDIEFNNADLIALGSTGACLQHLISAGQRLIERSFPVVLGKRYSLAAQKMVTGDIVQMHSDAPSLNRGEQENFRLLYYLNKEYVDAKGGHLLLFDGPTKSSLLDAVRPIWNTAIAVNLRQDAYHAVSRINSGERYSLTVAYWGYPLLFADASDRSRIKSCLEFIIESGLESIPFNDITLADHYYNIFCLIFSWGASVDAGVAALLFGLVGQQRRYNDCVPGARDKLRELAEGKPMKLITALNSAAAVEESLQDDVESCESIWLITFAKNLDETHRNGGLAKLREALERVDFLSESRRISINRSLQMYTDNKK